MEMIEEEVAEARTNIIFLQNIIHSYLHKMLYLCIVVFRGIQILGMALFSLQTKKQQQQHSQLM